VLDDVGKRNSGIGDSAVGVNFPEKNSEAPHITFAGKGLRPQGFGSCPLDRKLKFAKEAITLRFLKKKSLNKIHKED
jgi:hypothetical protein